MKVAVKKDDVIELCNTDNIDYILDYLDYLLIERNIRVNVIINDIEYIIDELKDYFILRNQLVRENYKGGISNGI